MPLPPKLKKRDRPKKNENLIDRKWENKGEPNKSNMGNLATIELQVISSFKCIWQCLANRRPLIQGHFHFLASCFLNVINPLSNNLNNHSFVPVIMNSALNNSVTESVAMFFRCFEFLYLVCLVIVKIWVCELSAQLWRWKLYVIL